MSLKLGLIGCSNVAKKNLFSYLENNSNYDLWIIGSRSSKNASEWANNYGAKHFGNYDDVINSDVDVVYISLPIGLHEEWCVKAAKKGIAARHSNVIAALVFVIENIKVIIAIPNPDPPISPDKPIFK